MNKAFVILIAAAILAFCGCDTQPQKAKTTKATPAEVKNYDLALPLMANKESYAKESSQHYEKILGYLEKEVLPKVPEIQDELKILRNYDLVSPAWSDDGLCRVNDLVPPPSPGENGIRVLVITPNQFSELPVQWQNLVDKAYVAQFLADGQCIMLKMNHEPRPLAYESLVVMHELRHYFQHNNSGKKVVDQYEHLSRELDAYEAEFFILDRLGLPGYETFLQAEVELAKTKLLNGKELMVNVNRKIMENMFGKMDEESLKSVGTIIAMRTAFKALDEMFPNDVAKQRKLNILATMY